MCLQILKGIMGAMENKLYDVIITPDAEDELEIMRMIGVPVSVYEMVN